MAETPRKETVEVVLKNWRAEVETAQVYRDLAARESDEKRKGILIRMAEAEERHARRWEQRLREMDEPVPVLTENIWTRFKRRFTRSLGTDIAIRRMEAAEEKHEREFSAQRDRALAGEQDVQEFLRTSALEEKAHARALNAMAGPPNPKTALDTILKRERWHGRGGSWVADANYGVNDGLGAVFVISSGVAGATNNQQHYVLISGLAGMLASALSMGAGAYLAVKSEGEVYEAEIAREKAEVEENPEQLVQAMAQSELGLSEHRFPNPWKSATSASVSTAVGAFIPIIPFFFMTGLPAVIVAFVISIVAHFAVGAIKSLITIRSWWASGFELTLVGVIEAVVTYGLGLAFVAAA